MVGDRGGAATESEAGRRGDGVGGRGGAAMVSEAGAMTATRSSAGVSVADTAAASGVLAEENAEMGRRLGLGPVGRGAIFF